MEVQPLFSAELELQAPDMVFQPALGEGMPDGFLSIVDGLVKDIYQISSLVPRVAQAGYNDYQVEN